jgi:hypothetical protein
VTLVAGLAHPAFRLGYIDGNGRAPQIGLAEAELGFRVSLRRRLPP